jgi:glycosyltransferase involved in cell wall biosynthesis
LNTAEPSILFLDQSGKLGGAELMLADIVPRVGRNNSVLLFDEGPFGTLLEQLGASVHVCSAKIQVTKNQGILSLMKAAPNMAKLVRTAIQFSKKHDLLYANTPKALMVGAIASFLSRKPLVFHLHDILDSTHFSRINSALIARTARLFAKQIIANSEATRVSYLRCSGSKKNNVHVVYNGFKTPQTSSPNGTTAQELRKEHGVPENSLVAAVIGRIAPWKGQHVILDALPLIPNFQVWIVGDALFTKEDLDYKNELLAMTKHSDQVRFLGFQNDLRGIYEAADVIVHTSVAPEPFGRVIVEGMLYGKPVVATRAGGAIEIVSDRKTGYLYEMGNHVELADVLNHLRSNKSETELIAERGQIDATNRFALDKVLEQIRKIVSNVFNVG